MASIRQHFQTLKHSHRVAQWWAVCPVLGRPVPRERRAQDVFRCHLHDTVCFANSLVAIPQAGGAQAER